MLAGLYTKMVVKMTTDVFDDMLCSAYMINKTFRQTQAPSGSETGIM